MILVSSHKPCLPILQCSLVHWSNKTFEIPMKTRTSGDAGTTRHIIVVALGCNVAVVVTLLSFIDICLNDQCLTDIQYLKII